jgi:hypothetical protein
MEKTILALALAAAAAPAAALDPAPYLAGPRVEMTFALSQPAPVAYYVPDGSALTFYFSQAAGNDGAARSLLDRFRVGDTFAAGGSDFYALTEPSTAGADFVAGFTYLWDVRTQATITGIGGSSIAIAAAVPEPGPWALLAGASAAGLLRRRRTTGGSA